MTQQAQALLAYLRAELRESGLAYAEPLTPLTGGFDTRIFTFRLSGAPKPFSIPLILRVLGTQYPQTRALVERAIQNAVAGLGFPAPLVLLASADPTILGGAFLVMERLSGRPLLDVRRFGLASALVETQLKLHALDPEVLLHALDREGPPISREMATFEGHVARLQHRVGAGGLHGLARAIGWLVEHRPTDGTARVICHGDFHPQNILAEDDRVTGVIDWPNVVVAERAFDVASTRVILAFAPLDLLGIPPALRPIVDLARRVLAVRYIAGYRRRHPLGAARLAYYEALACMRALIRTGETRLAAHRISELNPLDASPFGERLSARFARLTGIAPTLPPVPRAS